MVARRLASLLRPLAEALRAPELDDTTVLRVYPRSSAEVLQKELEWTGPSATPRFSLVSSLIQRSPPSERDVRCVAQQESTISLLVMYW